MDIVKSYRKVKKNGVQSVIINKNRILIVKRMNIPFFLIHPGEWAFISGAKEKDEDYIDAAYRETSEEIGLNAKELKLLSKGSKVVLFDNSRKIRWENMLFIFKTDKSKIKLNFENTAYKWVSYGELVESPEMPLRNFCDGKRVSKLIALAIDRKQPQGS